MAKAKAKRAGRPAAEPAQNDPASEIIAAIKAAGGKPWFQVHGDAHAKAIERLKAEGTIRWTNKGQGYVIIEKGAGQ